MMKTPKKKLKPSWEIYNRILWDEKFNQQAFYIGYDDRMIKDAFGEKMLVDWADNDIPWSRVQYIRCGDTLVWDRANRLDLFETEELPTEAYAVEKTVLKPTVLINGITIASKPVFALNSPATPILAVHAVVASKLKIVSFNVLTDKYEKELVQSAIRRPFIVSELLQTNADILLLQEVDAPLLKLLAEAQWPSVMYFSELERKPEHYYQELLIISKFPFSVMECQFSQQKKFPIATWNINEQLLHVANVHLTSNRANNATASRQTQLEVLTTYLDGLDGNVLLAGDFNTRGTESLALLEQHHFVDSWTSLHPLEEGFTFEPAKNSLSKVLTLTGLPARFDRIYLQEKSTCSWEFESVDLFATQPIPKYPELFISDHYGIATTILFQEINQDVELKESLWNNILATYHSGIVIIPPQSIWEPIQTLRKQFDSKVERWMPHITLVYGFLPDRYFEQAATEISDLVKSFDAFQLSLEQFQLFVQKNGTTAWLDPIEKQSSNQLVALQKILSGHFFMKNSKLKDLNKFKPHLSIGQFKSQQEALNNLPKWESIDFEVGAIALISRENQDAFNVRYQVALGSGQISQGENNKVSDKILMQLVENHQPAISLAHRQSQNFALELLQEACSAALGRTCSLNPLGSTALGTNSMLSDVDLLAAIPFGMDTHIFLENVLEELEGFYLSARLVADAQVPILKLNIEGHSIDLLCVQKANSFLEIETLQEQHRTYFDKQSWQAISGVLEVRHILKIVRPFLSLDSFQWLVKIIKTWASNRGIKGNAFGFLGSYSWTILAAWSCQRLPEKANREDLVFLLDNFFQLLVQYDWNNPLCLYDEANYVRRGKQDQMPILTSVKPFYNSARNITQSTAMLIQKELKRGAAILTKIKKEVRKSGVNKASFEELFAMPTTSFSHQIRLSIQAENETQLRIYSGWIEGHIVSLVIAIEQQCQSVVQPQPTIKFKGLSACTVLDVELTESSSLVELNNCVKDFVTSFSFDFSNNAALSFEIST